MRIETVIIIFAICMVATVVGGAYYYNQYYHTIKVGNQPGWCENDGEFHAFVYDIYGKGEYRGNWSQVKNFLVYQHKKYNVDFIIDSPTFGSGRTGDITYSLDEYITIKDKQCGNGSLIQYGLDVLDPGLTPIPTTITIVPTLKPTYDYSNSEFGKVAS